MAASMLTEFVTLQLSREELVEIHDAVLARTLAQEVLHEAHGENEDDSAELLTRLEGLLGYDEATTDKIEEEAEDFLWETAWHVFVREWASYRARQEVVRNLGAGATQLSPTEMDRQMELVLQKQFEEFVKEVSMVDPEASAELTNPPQPELKARSASGAAMDSTNKSPRRR